MYRLISVLLYGFGYDDLGVTCFYFEIVIEIPFQSKKKKKSMVMCKYFIKLQEILGVQLSVYFRSESCLHFI